MAKPKSSGRELLARYLEKHSIRVAACAAAIDVEPAAVFQWRSGKTKPSAINRAALETWSDGFIRADAWPALPAPKQVVPYGAA